MTNDDKLEQEKEAIYQRLSNTHEGYIWFTKDNVEVSCSNNIERYLFGQMLLGAIAEETVSGTVKVTEFNSFLQVEFTAPCQMAWEEYPSLSMFIQAGDVVLIQRNMNHGRTTH